MQTTVLSLFLARVLGAALFLCSVLVLSGLDGESSTLQRGSGLSADVVQIGR
jgi:hypothetical protein